MASLSDVRKRIGSVKNTQQITRAMKMVSAAKFRRAQEEVLRARPYAEKLYTVLQGLGRRADPEAHPLLRVREPKSLEVVVLASDRGLCGSFNSSVVRFTERHLLAEGPHWERIRMSVIGRKVRDYFRRRSTDIRSEFLIQREQTLFEFSREIGEDLAREFVSGELDEVRLIYNRFYSALTQRVVVKPILPLTSLIEARLQEEAGRKEEQVPLAEARGEAAPAGEVDYKYEPSADKLLEALLPRFVTVQIFQSLLESAASEHAARMTAMDSATRNAGEMIGSLTLKYNKARQAGITKDLMDIVNGAEALG